MIDRRALLKGAGAVGLSSAPVSAETAAPEIASGDRFSLGGEDFQLADIAAPSGYQLGAQPEPFFDAARDLLGRRLGDGEFDLSDVAPADRWGRRTVRARRRRSGESLAEQLVADGAVRVAPMTDDYGWIKNLLEIEKHARSARLGLWSLDYYSILSDVEAEQAIGRYGLVMGTVTRATEAASRLFLNFGEDYRTDFTASVPLRTNRKWQKIGIDYASFEGRLVLVRGHLASINGPSIDVTHPLQVIQVDV